MPAERAYGFRKRLNRIHKNNLRYFGKAGAELTVKAWKLWNTAMNEITSAHEDQYGLSRIGLFYPFISHLDITWIFRPQIIDMPSSKYVHFSSCVVKTFYHPFKTDNSFSWGGLAFRLEAKHGIHDHMIDHEHLEWKIRHSRRVLEYDLPTYRTMLKL
jgi:hypothetical protein